MERLTYDCYFGDIHWWHVKGAGNLGCRQVCEEQEENGCKGCPIELAFDRLAAYEDTGLAPEEVQQMRWIPVEKRLPEDDAPAGRKQITVMVTTKAGKVTIASRVFEPERDYCGKVYPARWLWSRWLNNHVTHWMELPAPPGKDNNVPTKVQNEPLTPEELREMDEPTPVWWEKAGYWCLCERGFIITPNGNIHEFEEYDWTFYRRPPEGEEK